MSEFGSALEDAASRVQAPTDAFERLAAVRTRHRRNRRLATGLVAVVVAAAGSSLAYVAFQGQPEEPGPASARTADPRILWPPPGQATSGCCGTPQTAVRAFARTELRWTRVLAAERRDLSEGTSGRVFTILPCGRGEFCPAAGFLISVARIPRPGVPATWSLIKVGTQAVGIALLPGATVRADPLRIPVELPEGMRVYAGLSLAGHGGPCAVADSATARQGAVEVTGARKIHVCGGRAIEFPAHGTIFMCAACHVRPEGSTGTDVFGLLRSLSPPGPLTGVAVVPVRFVSGGAQASPTAPPPGPYPRGAFQWCPDPRGTVPFGNSASKRASHTALRFSRAFLKHQRHLLHNLADPSARPHLDDPAWGITGDPAKISVRASRSARKDPLVSYGCGPDVAARTWEVTIDDGTPSASLDFTIYLVRRSGGWKVWGAY